MSEETSAAVAPHKKRLPPALKLALEMGPLVLFFIVNQKFGIFYGDRRADGRRRLLARSSPIRSPAICRPCRW